MSYTQQLYQLQLLDSETDAAIKRLQEITAGLVETTELKQARTAFKEAQIAYHQAKSQVTNIELEVKGLQQKITQNEQRLYGGKLTNPKEAASLQDDIAATKRWLAKREEDLLEAMISLEETQSTLAQREQTGKQILAAWEQSQSVLQAEQRACQATIQRLSTARPTIAQTITRPDLEKYQKLRLQKGGIAVAAIEDENCLMCGVVLSSRLIQQAETDNKLYFCDSCGRIIHIL